MGDVGDYWRDYKEYVRKKKQQYGKGKSAAIDRVKLAGFEVREISHGHYRVEECMDWWPSTGTWRETRGKLSGHGADSLINYMKKRGGG